MGLKDNYSITVLKQVALVSDEKLNEEFPTFNDQWFYMFSGLMFRR